MGSRRIEHTQTLSLSLRGREVVYERCTTQENRTDAGKKEKRDKK